MDNWIDFLETEYKRSIAKDTWNCMYDFVQLADADPTLATYDTDGLSPFVVRAGGGVVLMCGRCLAVNTG